MSNKTQLQTNNEALDGYINRINAAKQVAATLPESELDLTFYLDGTISGEYIDTKLTHLRFGAFAGTNLTKISLPNCVSMTGSRHFTNCPELEEVNIENVASVDGLAYIFNYCPKLKKFSMPKLEYCADTGAAFFGCSEIERIEFPKLSGTTLGNYCFRACPKLKTIIIGGDVLCPLNNENCFTATSNFTVYVKDELVPTYQGATNWSKFASKIKGLSQLPQEEVEE